jgi:hypothetical protein
VRLQSYHEGTIQVKTRLFETYKHEYENFSQLDGESIDAIFSRFQTIINKIRANKAQYLMMIMRGYSNFYIP